MVSVVLDVSTPEDIHARIDRVPDRQRKLQRALRLCHQAYEQGGLLYPSRMTFRVIINTNMGR
jgi:hypothetical protein